MPSSTGTPAATSAPNAMSRISSVTGRARTSARWKSFSTVWSSSYSALAWPNSPMKNPGWSPSVADVGGGRAERGVGDVERARLDEDRLAGRRGEAGVGQDVLGRGGLARGPVGVLQLRRD